MLGELSGIVNPSLRERIVKSIVGKLIKAKDNVILLTNILKLSMSLQMNFINQSLEISEKESQRE